MQLSDTADETGGAITWQSICPSVKQRAPMQNLPVHIFARAGVARLATRAFAVVVGAFNSFGLPTYTVAVHVFACQFAGHLLTIAIAVVIFAGAVDGLATIAVCVRVAAHERVDTRFAAERALFVRFVALDGCTVTASKDGPKKEGEGGQR